MCGIVGYITAQNDIYENARRGFFKYALMLDTLRGPDSTGVITVSNKFTVKRYKTISSGFRMATSEAFEANVPNGWAAIGHNRSATIGAVSVDNAHPFKFGRVSLVHNGTLSNRGKNLPEYDKNLSVDSMQLALSLSAVPPKEAVEVLDRVDGDMCLVWTDERDRSINMCRNRGRPMVLGFNFERSFMCFMSDGDHLQVLTKSFTNTSAHIPTLYSLDAYQLLKWKRGSLRPEVVEFRPFVHTSMYQGASYQPRQLPNLGPRTPTGSKAPAKSGKTSTEKDSTSKQSRTSAATASEKARKKWAKRQTKGTTKKQSRKSGSSSQSQPNDTTQTSIVGSGIMDGLRINRTITPYMGMVPKTNTKVMVDCMEKFFCTTPRDLTWFMPEEFYELTPDLYHVVGAVNLTGWGDTEWESTINFVSKKQADAHAGMKWLVRPIGITRNRSVDNCPGMLLELIHCDWVKYTETTKANELINIGKKQNPDDDIVLDPAGKLINREQLEKRLEMGCINCHTQLEIDQCFAYEFVNEGRDIVCETCKWEMKWPLESE